MAFPRQRQQSKSRARGRFFPDFLHLQGTGRPKPPESKDLSGEFGDLINEPHVQWMIQRDPPHAPLQRFSQTFSLEMQGKEWIYSF